MYINKIRFLSAVLLALSLSLVCNYAQAKDKPAGIDLGPSEQTEMIEEVSRFTGLAPDVLTAVMGDSPALFTNLSDTVTAVKVVDMFYNAKDSEAVAEVANWYLSGLADKSVATAFGTGAASVFAAAKAYQASLEIYRDYKFIPDLDKKIYNTYKANRLEDMKIEGPKGGGGEETVTSSFDYATTGRFLKGYYHMKYKMLDDYLMEKYGKPREELSDKMVDHATKQVDDYWMKRMEAKFQQELLKENKDKYVQEIWEKQAKQLEAIRAAAAKMSGPQRFFFSEKDIPQGWKKEKEGPHRTYKFTPKEDNNPNNPGWVQGFSLYKAEYTQKGDDFFTADGKKVRVNDIDVTIFISPRMAKYVTDKNIPFETDWLDTIKYMLDNPESPNPGQKLLGEFKEEGVVLGYVQENTAGNSGEVGNYQIDFVKGPWRVLISVGGDPLSFIQRDEAHYLKAIGQTGGKPDRIYDKTTVSEDLARTIARTVARKIPAGESGQKEAKKK